MIIEKLSFRNFFSVGNSPIEIDFQKDKKALIIGTNGAGKSTFISALCYGLYGKPFKEVNMPTMVNSINKKNLLVEVDFQANGKSYKVRRGIKPKIFEIIEDGKPLDQTGASKDFQEILEVDILKVNFSAFKQIVVVGSGGYTPFMKLKASERRSIVENILSLNSFSTMNTLLKGLMEENKAEYEAQEKNVYKNNMDIRSSAEKIQFLRKQKNIANEEIEEERKKLNQQIDDIKKEISDIDQKLEPYSNIQDKLTEIRNKREKLLQAKNKVELFLDDDRKHLHFLSSHEVCPTCEQHIEEDLRLKKSKDFATKENANAKKLSDFAAAQEKVDRMISNLMTSLEERDTLLRSKSQKMVEMNSLSNRLDGLSTVIYDDSLLQSEINNLRSLQKIKDTLQEEMDEIVDQREIYKISGTILKDSGVKSVIISKYIPFINSAINKYLDTMNFYVQFEIDENFNEVIRSRHRDIFTYENFSEGEKARIDLALLFAWRSVTKKRSNMNCNLLILDETFDGSLDENGTNDLLNILNNVEDSNVFVISHKTEAMIDKFDAIYKMEKRNNFTEKREITVDDI